MATDVLIGHAEDSRGAGRGLRGRGVSPKGGSGGGGGASPAIGGAGGARGGGGGGGGTPGGVNMGGTERSINISSCLQQRQERDGSASAQLHNTTSL